MYANGLKLQVNSENRHYDLYDGGLIGERNQKKKYSEYFFISMNLQNGLKQNQKNI
jgi:hypothetical protein